MQDLPGLWYGILWLTKQEQCSIYVHMLIHGTPITAAFPSDPRFKERFFYWCGASGRKYIHSVYGLDECPPLPGAIYVAVRREGPLRLVMGIGRFGQRWDTATGCHALSAMRERGVDEIHAHLLAKSPEVIEAVLEDLLQAYEAEDGASGFGDVAQRVLL
jgi:hypothetical protein